MVIHHADSSVTPVVEHLGVRVTAVERTVADCARTLPLTASVPVVDAALHRRWALAPQLADYLEVQRRWAGMPRARLALSMADGRRESWLESYSFVRLDRLGVPGWRAQVLVLDAGGELLGRVDGLWEDCAVVAEVDGRGKYLDGVLGPTGSTRRRRSSPRRCARTPSATSAWRWCAGTSPSCSSGRCSWPRGSSAHGPGAAGPLQRPGHLLTRTTFPPRPDAPQCPNPDIECPNSGSAVRPVGQGAGVRRGGGR